MGCRRAHGVARWAIWSPGVLLFVLCGCALLPWNSFLDPTKVGRFGLDAHEGGIRRVLTARDTPPGIANATEPTPDDLAPTYEEYRLGPGDTVALNIPDLIAQGQPFQAVLEVSALGEIRVPEIGSIKVTGLTEAELEREVAARLKEAAILPRPTITAFLQVKRSRVVTVIGAVGQSGTYPIGEPDLRLLDVLGMIGDVSPNVKKMYVIRRESGKAGELPAGPAPTAPASAPWVIPPPGAEGAAPGGLMTTAGTALQEPGQAPAKKELEEVLTPPAKSRPATGEAVRSSQPAFGPIIFDPQTGQVIEPPPQEPRVEAPAAPRAPEQAPEKARLEEPFDWSNIESYELEQRVIAIDVGELKAGNARYNIAVRNRDVVNVPVDTGVFYMMGEIQRPGVYAFGGRDITIKQSLAIAGGFTPLAWPQRCELIRREPGTDKQTTLTVDLDAIYYGLQEDLYLRDDDVVNIGTHVVAPFLFVIRNSFRFTYGFGFVYDRNFADVDSYGQKVNPQILAEQRRAQRGLSF